MIRLWLADFEGFCSIEGGVNAPNAPPCQPTSLAWSERWMFACHPLFPVCPHQSAAMWLRSEPFVPHEALPPPPRPQGNVDRVNLQLVHITIHKWLPLCVCVWCHKGLVAAVHVCWRMCLYIVFLYDKCTHQHMYVCAGAHQVAPYIVYIQLCTGVLMPVNVHSWALGCGHMYGSARGRQILLYKINPNPNPNTNTNPSRPYCIMRFIFGSCVHVPSREPCALKMAQLYIWS